MKPIFTNAEWTFELIEKVWERIDDIGKNKYGLSYYRPQIEIITSEQMLDAYSSVAMPIMYNHWSYGKDFIKNNNNYKKGKQGLAYEVVINTNPTLAYLMENNSMTMQTLVLAHAVCGHGSFFKNNYMFTEFTDADLILDYLTFAKNYIEKCEEQYGVEEVETLLDACHALRYFGVDKYKKGKSKETKEERKRKWMKYTEESYNDIWRTVPTGEKKEKARKYWKADIDFEGPYENILYVVEKFSPKLRPWQKEIVRIVRKISQYFYPQMQTQVMNEGWASFWHYTIMNDLYEEGSITAGSYLEFIEDHSAVIFQPEYDSPYYSGINPYALGFAMMQDIKRICQNPDEEDYKYNKDIAGTDWLDTMKFIVENFKDESFILQFLGPKVIRKFKLFSLMDDSKLDKYEISGIHNKDDVETIRECLAEQYNLALKLPQIEVIDIDFVNSRDIFLKHNVINGVLLGTKRAYRTLNYLKYLWGHEVYLDSVDSSSGKHRSVDLYSTVDLI